MNYLDNLLGKTVAVVGLGYIGSRLFTFLKNFQEKLDIEIFGVTRQNIDLLSKRNFDYVFNCAGNTGDFRQQPIKTVTSNIQLNTHLLEQCRITESLVCLSSTRVYGFSSAASKEFTEESFVVRNHLALDALYDNAKILMECLLLNTPRNYKRVVIRLSNVFGDYKLKDLEDSTFLKLMLRHKYQNENLIVRQNINSSKDYVFINDALEGILRGGILSKADNVYNICSGKSYSVKDWAEFLDLPIQAVSDAPALHSKVSNKKAGKHLGFVSKYDLKSLSLTNIIKYE